MHHALASCTRSSPATGWNFPFACPGLGRSKTSSWGLWETLFSVVFGYQPWMSFLNQIITWCRGDNGPTCARAHSVYDPLIVYKVSPITDRTWNVSNFVEMPWMLATWTKWNLARGAVFLYSWSSLQFHFGLSWSAHPLRKFRNKINSLIINILFMLIPLQLPSDRHFLIYTSLLPSFITSTHSNLLSCLRILIIIRNLSAFRSSDC